LREFHILRLADVAGLLFASSVVAAVVASVLGALASWLLPAAVLLAVWAGHTVTRFRLTPGPLRFVAAAVLNLPLITAYLFGRTVGVIRLSVGRL
jgi:hypothetical protein